MERTNQCVWCSGKQLTIGSKPSGIVFRRSLTTSGFAVSAWCTACERPAKPGHFEPHALFSDDECCAMPWVRSAGAEPQRACEVCAEVALLELHHLAPREMFGDDCERWPTVRVCRRCHERWHHTVDMYRSAK